MRVLKLGKKTDRVANYTQTVTCGDSDNSGCGTTFEINHNDIYRTIRPMQGAVMIFLNTKCPHCHESVTVNPKNVPDTDRIPELEEWLETRQKGLVATLYAECEPNGWAELRMKLIEDGLPSSFLEEMGL